MIDNYFQQQDQREQNQDYNQEKENVQILYKSESNKDSEKKDIQNTEDHLIHKRRLVVRVPFAQTPDQSQLHRLYKTLFANKEKKFL